MALALDDTGRLPPGRHPATLAEVERAFCYTDERRQLFRGLVRALAALKDAGIRRVYLGGSFVTNARTPRDVDGSYIVEAGVDPEALAGLFDPAGRSRLLREHGVDFLPDTKAGSLVRLLSRTRDDERVGVVVIALQSEDLRSSWGA